MSLIRNKQSRHTNKENKENLSNMLNQRKSRNGFTNYQNINGKRNKSKNGNGSRGTSRDTLKASKLMKNKRRAKKTGQPRRSLILEEKKRNKSRNVRTKRSRLVERNA